MARRQVRHTETYVAEEIGRPSVQHRINVFTEYMQVSFLSGASEWVEGLKSHKMASSGNHVNVYKDGALEEVATGLRMQRVAVAATP